LFLLSTIIAQDNKKPAQLLNEASFIFKGTVVETTRFKGEGEESFLVSYVINVETIYKGDELSLGNITLVAKTGMRWREKDNRIIEQIETGHSVWAVDEFSAGGVGMTSVFVCNKYHNIIEIPKSKREPSNKFTVEPVFGSPYLLFSYEIDWSQGVNNQGRFEHVKGFGKTFEQFGKQIRGRGTIWNEGLRAWEQLDSYFESIGIIGHIEANKKK
jgi:hypothetical protein